MIPRQRQRLGELERHCQIAWTAASHQIVTAAMPPTSLRLWFSSEWLTEREEETSQTGGALSGMDGMLITTTTTITAAAEMFNMNRADNGCTATSTSG